MSTTRSRATNAGRPDRRADVRDAANPPTAACSCATSSSASASRSPATPDRGLGGRSAARSTRLRRGGWTSGSAAWDPDLLCLYMKGALERAVREPDGAPGRAHRSPRRAAGGQAASARSGRARRARHDAGRGRGASQPSCTGGSCCPGCRTTRPRRRRTPRRAGRRTRRSSCSARRRPTSRSASSWPAPTRCGPCRARAATASPTTRPAAG